MSSPSTLEVTLNEILRVINPSREDFETRTRIVDELREVVGTIDSLRGATVEPFGSFLSQLYTCSGDLDVSIELSNGLYISTAARKLKQTLLAEVLKSLRRTGAFRRMQFVLHARVPILKLESKYQNISCDISINNLSGQMKSKFLLWISLIDRRFRDMVLLVKEWAKANDINNPKTGTLNSYSLSLLVIFHFQTCVPAILPPLKDIYPGNVADELIGVRADVERHIEEVSAANIAKFRKERRINHSSLPELFTSFVAKFSSLNTKAAEQGICTYTGQWEHISTNTRWLPRTYAIFIEDPFEQPENTARAVNSNQLTRIAEAFTSTYLRLTARNPTRNGLIPSLVRPELLRFFPGIPYRNGAAYPRNHQNVPRRSNHSQSQAQLHEARQAGGDSDNATAQKQPKQGYQRQSQGKPRNRPNRMRQGGPQEIQGQGQGVLGPILPQVKKPQLPPASVQGGQANNAGAQRSVKGGSQGQSQQVWRPKQ